MFFKSPFRQKKICFILTIYIHNDIKYIYLYRELGRGSILGIFFSGYLDHPKLEEFFNILYLDCYYWKRHRILGDLMAVVVPLLYFSKKYANFSKNE